MLASKLSGKMLDSARWFWNRGFDTHWIALCLNVDEASVYNSMDEIRGRT